jgi:hypothetical protein
MGTAQIYYAMFYEKLRKGSCFIRSSAQKK